MPPNDTRILTLGREAPLAPSASACITSQGMERDLSQKPNITKATAGVDAGLPLEEVSHLVGRLSYGFCLEIPYAGTNHTSSEGESEPGDRG